MRWLIEGPSVVGARCHRLGGRRTHYSTRCIVHCCPVITRKPRAARVGGAHTTPSCVRLCARRKKQDDVVYPPSRESAHTVACFAEEKGAAAACQHVSVLSVSSPRPRCDQRQIPRSGAEASAQKKRRCA